ncbi:MAG: LysM domain-containing protein [Desulfobacterales bacterium]|nr:LysM domain-containing protein [Desulfobacterales bacterium]
MRKLFITWLLIILICIIPHYSAGSALLSKSYLVRYDKGRDILCDPYVVQKDDWVFKLFRQKGEISHKDFPEFLAIFKRLNPRIRNIDMIRPGQHILIPLKKLKKNSLPGQSSGIVTIPLVTISNLPDIIKPLSTEYIVRKGDYISRLIARGYDTKYGEKPYNEAMKLFMLINPDVVDLDRIYQGQKLYIPNSSIRNQPWYKSLFQSSGNVTTIADLTKLHVQTPESFISKNQNDKAQSLFAAIASILDAKLLNKGTYSFPRQGKADYKLDLSSFPLIELKDKTKILLSQTTDKNKKINGPDLNAIKSGCSNVKIVLIANKASAEQALDSVMESFGKEAFKNKISFSDQDIKVEVCGKWIIEQPYFTGEEASRLCITPVNNLDELTPDSIVRYLEQHNIIIKDFLKDFTKNSKGTKHKSKGAQKEDTAKVHVTIDFSDHKTFVNNLMTAIGCNYTQNVAITFPYAGIQIKALSNLVSTRDGKSLLVDFGDIYGDAVFSIKKTGLGIIQINNKDNAHEVIRKILDALEVSYTNDPTFMAAKRPDVYNTSLAIPGYLISNKEKHKTLIATAPVNDDVAQFLTNQGIKVIQPLRESK